MNKNILTLIPMLVIAPQAARASLEFSGTRADVITVVPENSSGLEAVYVVDDASGVSVSCRYTGATAPVWYRFSNLGGGYAEEIASTSAGGVSTVALTGSDVGYIVETGGRQYCYWIVNYANHEPQLHGIAAAQGEADCDRIALNVDGAADRITYYSVNGRGIELSREFKLSYSTLEYSEDMSGYRQVTATETYAYLPQQITAPAPYCATDFTIEGDRFISRWGRTLSVTSSMVQPEAVAVHTTAVQAESGENDNEVRDESASGLGGSAPAEITFTAAVTDAAVFREWQMASDPDFEHVDNRFSDLELTYTFREQGTLYVRFMAANADGTCEAYGDTYEVSIGESSLKCPNAFSPGSTPGVNDEWKVSYKSLVSFECHIFNRWGARMATLTDPSQGWDGHYKGKLVPAGVYFYVIKARGADGRDYNLKGDINIINSSVTSTGGGSASTVE